ncbi:hypothetical protein BDQ17DRAFT_1250645 [Cyathus striatus]|nr:hypothetical protein BDQ17DRAFT_1250645 [Cyathus striatus]
MPPVVKHRLPVNPASRFLYTLFSLIISIVRTSLLSSKGSDGSLESIEEAHVFSKRATEVNIHEPKSIVFIILIPVLVLLSGLFAGLTLGYMSLDETQLSVLSVSGTPKQREYARKIQPIRKNGHLLLVTLLLSNMIVNESLPVIADPVLGGGVQSVVVSTVLIVIFSEIIPQSIFTRHGLYLGAKMAGLTTVLIWVMGVIAWPVAKLLEWILGPHHGIIYRRAGRATELKELIAMHSNASPHGGDLKSDTVNIIGATLDFQEKTVLQAMTPISDVFMLSIDAKLDNDTMLQVMNSGHSRIPIFEEIDIPSGLQLTQTGEINTKTENLKTENVKRIIGILLVKRLVSLNVQDAVPVRSLQLNKVFTVPSNQSLLGILDKFQEGHSHLAVVSRLSIERVETIKNVEKRGLTRQLKETVAAWDSDADTKKTGEKPRVHKYDIKMTKQTSKESPTLVREVEVSSNGRDDYKLRDHDGSKGHRSLQGQAVSDDAVLSEENIDAVSATYDKR